MKHRLKFLKNLYLLSKGPSVFSGRSSIADRQPRHPGGRLSKTEAPLGKRRPFSQTSPSQVFSGTAAIHRKNKESQGLKRTNAGAGFSLVGALSASIIGTIAVTGLVKLSSNIVNSINKSRKEFDLMTLGEEIKHHFQQGHPTPCDTNTQDCYNSCTSSLAGYNAGATADVTIREPSPSGVGLGKYFAGQQPFPQHPAKIMSIKYEPVPASEGKNRGRVNVHLSMSDDPRERLSAPLSLRFIVFIEEKNTGGTIKRCSVAGEETRGGLGGAGLPGIKEACRKVDGQKTLVGCGGTEKNTGAGATSFGFHAGKSSSKTGNSFFGYKAGSANTTGSNNTFFGYQAGLANTTGSNNIFLGSGAGKTNTTGSNNIAIGRNITLKTSGHSDQLNIGDLLTGEFLRIVYSTSKLTPKTKTPKSTESLSEVTIKGQLKITPPSTNPEPGLFVLGQAWIKKNTLTTTPFPEFQLWPDETKIDPLLSLKEGGLKVGRGGNPGLLVHGEFHLASRSTSAVAKLQPEGTNKDPQLTIANNLKVGKASGGGNALEVTGDAIFSNRLDTKNVTVKAEGSSLSDPPTMNIMGKLEAGAGTGTALKVKGDMKLGGATIEPIGKAAAPEVEISKLTATGKGTSEFQNNLQVNTLKGNLQFSGTPKTITITHATAGAAQINGSPPAPYATLGVFNHWRPQVTQALANLRVARRIFTHGASPTGKQGLPNPGPKGPPGLPGSDDIRYRACRCCTRPCCPPPKAPSKTSSRVYKKNIKLYKDFEKSLEDIVNTPLFTYQFKEERPGKNRMGVISEELPKDLQILSKGAPSTPDWVSIYGTLWAGIKALFLQWEDFKKQNAGHRERMTQELTKYFTKQLDRLNKELTVQITALEKNLPNREKKLLRLTQKTDQTAQRLAQMKKQLEEVVIPLRENHRRELKSLRKELQTLTEKAPNPQ